MKVRLLGCGTSSGVPRIGNDWGTCDPAEPKNRRRRVSILVEQGDTRVLVDTSPDLREQLLDAGVSKIDAVIWTHDHADHCHGIDDLRQIFHFTRRPVPGYARPETLAVLQRRFDYVFEGSSGYPPTVEAHLLPDALAIGALDIRIIDQPHGSVTSAGICFEYDGKRVVYSTDFNAITADMISLFEDVDLWIVDALRERPHPTHPHLAQALEWIEQLHVRHAILTHMDQSMDYQQVRATLPPHVEPGFDGLEVVL
jgi:phosphoribosyl 1,2-cyclic phosphate phosphodiesterase